MRTFYKTLFVIIIIPQVVFLSGRTIVSEKSLYFKITYESRSVNFTDAESERKWHAGQKEEFSNLIEKHKNALELSINKLQKKLGLQFAPYDKNNFTAYEVEECSFEVIDEDYNCVTLAENEPCNLRLHGLSDPYMSLYISFKNLPGKEQCYQLKHELKKIFSK